MKYLREETKHKIAFLIQTKRGGGGSLFFFHNLIKITPRTNKCHNCASKRMQTDNLYIKYVIL